MKRVIPFLLSVIIALLFLHNNVQAQLFPVQTTPQLLAPNTLNVSEYYGNDSSQAKLNLLLLLRDVNRPVINVRLRMTIESQSLRIRSREDVSYQNMQFELQTGVPRYVQPFELAQYFNASNLEFSGISEQDYVVTGKLPEGFYTFCFEAVDMLSGQTVSNKGCAFAWIAMSEPPFLTLPFKGEAVTPRTPQNLLFQWTPRHGANPNAYQNSAYSIRIVELPDNSSQSPEADFLSGPTFHSDSGLLTTNYTMGPGKPQMVPGKKYAWQVQVRTQTGFDPVQFRNSGFSEIWHFTYQNDCPLPTGVTDSVRGQQATIRWQSNPRHLEYKIDYREVDNANAEWFSQTNTQPYFVIRDLKVSTTYEYKPSAYCEAGVPAGDSAMYTFTTSADTSLSTVPDCNNHPAAPDTTGNLGTPLQVNDTIYAGDFKVIVTGLTNAGPGTVSGNGYVEVPWIGGLTIAVHFDNITLNDQKRLKTGEIKTTYDPSESGIGDLDELIDVFVPGYGVGGVVTGLPAADTTFSFVINQNPLGITVNPLPPATGPYQLTITPEGGGPAVIYNVQQLPTTMMDAGGNIYQVNAQGQVVPIGKAGGDVLLKNTNRKLIDSDKGLVRFIDYDVEKVKFAFDAWRPEYKKSNTFNKEYERIKCANDKGIDGDSYYVSAKAIAPGATDYLKVEITKADAGLKPDSVEFVSGKGTIYNKTFLDSANGKYWYELAVIGGPDKDAQEIYALYKQSAAKTLNLGKVLVASYPKVNKDLILIPVNAVSVNEDSLEAKLNKIYNRVNIFWSVSYDNQPPVNNSWDKNHDGKLEITDDRNFKIMTDEMAALNKLYIKNRSINKSAVYLYTIAYNDILQPGIYGGMPRGQTFGYLFVNSQSELNYASKILVTAAHEIGHGLFRLEHPFEYGGLQPNELPQNLMDYSFGEKLSKMQWDILADPPIVVRGLENEEDNLMISGNFSDIPASLKNSDGSLTCLTPSKKIVTIPSNTDLVFFSTADPYYFSSTTIRTGEIAAIGSLVAFKIGNKYYDFRGKTYQYYCEKCTGDEKEFQDDLSNTLIPSTAIVGFPSYENKRFSIDLLKYTIKPEERVPNNNTISPPPNKVLTFGNAIVYYYSIIDVTNLLTPNNVTEYGLNFWNLYNTNSNSPKIDGGFHQLTPFAEDFLEKHAAYTKPGSPLAAGVISLAHWFSISEAFEGQGSCRFNEQEGPIYLYKRKLRDAMYDPEGGPPVSQSVLINQAKAELFYAYFYRYRDLINALSTANKDETNLDAELDKLVSVSEIKQKINSLTTCQIESISFENRLRFIKTLEPANEEEVIIKLIANVDYGNQAGKLLDELFKNQANLFRKLWLRLDFSEFHEYIAKVTEISKADYGVGTPTLYFNFSKETGAIGSVYSMDYRYEGDYLVIEKERGPGDDDPQYFLPNEMINVIIPKEDSYIKYSDNQTDDITIQIPAYYVAYLIHKKKFDQTITVLRVAGNLVAIAFAIPTGGQSLTITAGISAGLASADLVVCYLEESLQNSEAGRSFLNIWQYVQFADAGVGVANIAGKGYKAIAIKFDDFIAKIATLDFTKRTKLLYALRHTPQLLQRMSLSSLERLFTTKILARIESEILKKTITFFKDAQIEFKNWVTGIIKYESLEEVVFDVAVSSNGAYLKFVNKLEDLFEFSDKVVAKLTNVRYFDDATGVVREGKIYIVYNPVSNAFRGVIYNTVRKTYNNFKNIFKANIDEVLEAGERIKNYRASKNLSGKNCGYIEGSIQGEIRNNKIWESGPANVETEPQIFTAINAEGSSGKSWLRNTDSEYKMLNKLAKDLGGTPNSVNPNITGELKIVSENPYCISCQGIIQQFNTMFPNIKLILVDGAKL